MKYWFLTGIFLISGCVGVRSYTIEKPRVDTTIEGNQGYLSGTPKGRSKVSRLGDTRKISVVEIELGSSKVKKGSSNMVEEEAFIDQEIVYDSAGIEEMEVSEFVAEQEYKTYTVQKNDTLQKISKKFYGTTKKWKMLFEANRDTLKSPDRLYPGKKIKIPVLN
ncbi:MAG: LysM peptidoglycan-binding domain-containing protein [Candidatus Omnitrophica bacterium]|nr:LysM peptidoglycan-binding domain-containing protein [Candidatus Omnitrophota bacterium]MDD5430240.1 LysM peptidoglycan-binding domain-containing protein [Candidatus Omnitrophota bacterium]